MKQIIYIMGRGHSGSTTLDSLLGNAPNSVGVGELVSGWNRTSTNCSCGTPAGDCEFWRGVRRRFASTPSSNWELAGRISAWQANVLRIGYTILRRSPRSGIVQITEDAFKCIAEEAQVDSVIDSGKEFTRALFLLRNFNMTKVVFLIRRCDAIMASRLHLMNDGTGFKMLRRVSRNRSLTPVFMIATAINWLVGNLIGESIRLAFSKRVMKLCYEDLCANPTEAFKRLEEFLEIDLSGVSRNVAEGRPMPIGHKIAGNSMRESGTFVFNPCLSKSRPLPRPYRAVAKIIGAPLLWCFGYATSVSRGNQNGRHWPE